MSNLDARSIFKLLQPFYGYLQLKMFNDAVVELNNLPENLKDHPAVLQARLFSLVRMGKWEDGVLLGESLYKLWPLELGFYLNTALCLHRLGRTSEAKATLESALESIRDTVKGEGGNYYFDLACYETQLENLDNGKRLLKECFAKEPQYREKSLHDPDLEPLWEWVRNIK